MSNASDLVPSALNAYVGVQTAGLFWLINHFVSSTFAILFVRKSRLASEEAYAALSSAIANLQTSVTKPLNTAIIYFTSLLQFVVSNLGWLVLAIAVVVLSFLLINFQRSLIVFVDDVWEVLFPVLITPVRNAFNLLIIILEIAVGIINFISQYTSSVLLDTSKLLINCNGYYGSFFDVFSNFAASIAAAAESVSSWIVGSLSQNLELRTVVAPLRLVAYDSVLRFQCACPADRGVLDIVTTGILDPTTTVFDEAIHYGLNTPLSALQVVLSSVIAAASSGTYVAPKTDIVFDNFSGFVNATQGIANAVFINGVGFIESLITLGIDGHSDVPWPAVPVFSIIGRQFVLTSEIWRVVTRSVVNAPAIWNSPPAGYPFLDVSRVYAASLDLSQAVWVDNFGHLYQQTLMIPGTAIRDFQDIMHAQYYFYAKALTRLMLGRDSNNPMLYGKASFQDVCQLPTNIVYGSGFSNFWSMTYDVMGEYDRIVTAAKATFANSFAQAMAPYYAPLGNSINLYIIWQANADTLLYRRLAYMVYAVLTDTPPSYVCISSLGRPTRVAHLNFIESLGDFAEFFLNINKARALRSAHFNCKDQNVHNFALTGTLQSYYFASKMCNTRYQDKTLVQCDFANSTLCPNYELAYSDMNVQLLCASDEFLVQTMRSDAQESYIVGDIAWKAVTLVVACVVDPKNQTTCPRSDSTILQVLVDAASQVACTKYAELVKMSNIASSIVAFGFRSVYDSFKGSNYGPGQRPIAGMASSLEAYNSALPTSPDLLTYIKARTGVSGADPCAGSSRQASEAACFAGQSSPGLCQWDGGSCFMNTHTHLAFQPYPLEAALSTWIVAVSSITQSEYNWYIYYAVYQLANRYADTLTVDLSTADSVSGAAKMVAKIESALVSDVYFVILDGARIATIAGRDFLYGNLELIRTYIYVFNNGNFPPAYVKFQSTMLRIIQFLEQAISSFVNEGFSALVDIAFIVQDFANVALDPKNAVQYLNDVLVNLLDIINKSLAAFKNFVLSFPGIETVCNDILAVIEAVEGAVNGFVTKAIIPALNGIQGILNQISNGIETVIDGILDFINAVASGIMTFIAGVKQGILAVTDAIQRGLMIFEAGINVFKSQINSAIQGLRSVIGGINSAISGLRHVFGRRHMLAFLNVKRPVIGSVTIPGMDALKKFSLAAPFSCPANLGKGAIPFAATQCTYDTDCLTPTSYCVIEALEQCNSPNWFNGSGAVFGGINVNDAWDKPCACTELTSKNSYCNYASGFCQAGISPYGDPIKKCPAKGVNAFVADNDYFNAMCWIVPAYQCAPKDGMNRTDAQVTTCINNLLSGSAPAVTGPHLCRDFCSPSLFDQDNRLITHPTFGCACAVGWSVAAGRPPPAIGAPLLEPVAAAFSGRRMLEYSMNNTRDFLSDEDINATTTAWYETPLLFKGLSANGTSFCANVSHCERWDAVCDSAAGKTLCASCPVRNFYSGSGVMCQQSQCTCEPVPSTPLAIDFSRIVWEGTSRCALLGRAYGKRTSMEAIHYTELRDCAHEHFKGVILGKFLDLPTLAPRVMYDNAERYRVAAHVSAGLVLGTLFYEIPDQQFFEMCSALRVDPALAVPARRVVHGAAQQVLAVTPRVQSFLKHASLFLAKTSLAWTSVPSLTDMTNAKTFFVNTTVSMADSVAMSYNSTERMQNIYDEIQTFRLVNVATEAFETRRRLLSTVYVPAKSCPILTIFVSDFKTTATNAISHFTHNVPRAVCRFNNPSGGDTWTSCPQPSWAYSLPPPPPSPPTKQSVSMAHPPPPSLSNTLGVSSAPKRGAFQTIVFKVGQALFSVDLETYIISNIKSALDHSDQARANLNNAVGQYVDTLKCQYATSVGCYNKNNSLLYWTIYTTIEILIAFAVIKFLRFGSLTVMVVPFALVIFYPTVMKRTYGLEFGCSLSLTPVTPPCFVSDIQDLAYTFLPRHLPWPSPLVNVRGREISKVPNPFGKPLQAAFLQPSDVLDCGALGFGDGTRELIYALDYLAPSWRSKVSSVTTSTLFGLDFVKDLNVFNSTLVHTHAYEQCAALYSVTAFPLVLVIITALVFTVCGLHLAFLFVRYFLLFLKDIYRAAALSYIDTVNQSV